MSDFQSLRSKVIAELLSRRESIEEEYGEILARTPTGGTPNDSSFRSFADFLDFSLSTSGQFSLRDVMKDAWPEPTPPVTVVDKTFFKRLES